MKDKDQPSDHFSAAYSLKTNAQTRDHYRSWARSYDKEVGEDNAYAQPFRAAEMLQRYVRENNNILDAGCGSGLSGLALTDAGYTQVDGCDFSPEMITVAKQKDCYRTLFQADLNAGLSTVPNAAYDGVTCVGVFSFGHVYPDACDELLRVLRPGGYLIIALNEQYWDQGDLRNKLKSLEDAGVAKIRVREYGDHLPGHNVNGWVIALEKL